MHSLLLVALLLVPQALAARIGDAFGTNIHWTEAASGEAALLATAYRVARMDFGWTGIEHVCGTYDFSAYDGLLATMEAVGVRPYWILDYNNEACYPSPGSSCSTSACIAGYGRFAAAAAAHFAGHGIIWESVNEANGMGQDNATTITALCQAAGPHFLALGETFVGPTTAGIDFPYLNATFQAGILSALSGVSVHPYRSGAPESASAELRELAALIASYRPGAADVLPILSGEWGYTSAVKPCDYGNRVPRQLQGKYVPRMWMAALLGGATVGINYDWKDDGDNISACESNFGSVTQSAGAVFTPKPAFLAARAFQQGVGGATAFAGRLAAKLQAPAAWQLTDDSAFVLGFSEPGAAAFAVWTNVSTCVAESAPGARRACGGPAGVDEAGCLALGCCHDEAPVAPDVPACYFSLPQAASPGDCPAAERADCGYNGIGQNECISTRGCCWDASPQPAGPQCFFHTNQLPGGPLNITFSVQPAAPAYACFDIVDVFGYARGATCASEGELTILATDGPQYLTQQTRRG